jgi:hypothetical protein
VPEGALWTRSGARPGSPRDSPERALGNAIRVNARLPGDLLDGRYELGERIGSGGMGTVHRAHDTRLDRTVAVKLLHHGRDVDDTTRARLRAEARFAGALQHPGIVKVFDYGEEPGENGPTPYVVMQYIEGTPVSEMLRDRGALPAATVAALLDDVARALVVAHAAGIVHRDLKPSNILVTASGRAVLVDFGVARSDTTEPLTETGQIIGSADYLSPEQVRGQRATPASDVYALGVVAHQCLSATSPFRRDTQAATLLARLLDDPPELDGSIPTPMRSLVSRMMASAPAERPTAADIVDELATLDQDHGPVLAPAAPAAPGHARAWDRSRLAAIAVAAALVLVIGSVLTVVRGHQATPPAGAAELIVPSVRGEQVTPATRVLEAAGFGVVRRLVDRPSARGTVLRQSPAPGVYAGKAPATVVLEVASGWVELDSDDLLGTTYAATSRKLRRLGLAPRRVDRPTSNGVGTVVAVDREGRIRVGSSVVLSVAVAPAVPATTRTRAPATSPAAKPRAPKPKHGKPAKHGKPGKKKKKH